MSRVGLELTVHFWICHYKRSEESALVYGWTDAWQNSRSLTASRGCLRTVPSLKGLGSISRLPSTPPAAACWARLFRAYGAGFCAGKFHQQIQSFVLARTLKAVRDDNSEIAKPPSLTRDSMIALRRSKNPVKLGLLDSA